MVHFTSITEISSNVSAMQLDIAVTGGNITMQDGVIARLRFYSISSGDENNTDGFVSSRCF